MVFGLLFIYCCSSCCDIWKSDYVLTYVCEEFIYVTVASLADNGVQAPLFHQEPISELMFSNESGSQISCTAHGTPPPNLMWTQKDGSPITSVLGLRYNLQFSGQIMFISFRFASFWYVLVWLCLFSHKLFNFKLIPFISKRELPSF